MQPFGLIKVVSSLLLLLLAEFLELLLGIGNRGGGGESCVSLRFEISHWPARIQFQIKGGSDCRQFTAKRKPQHARARVRQWDDASGKWPGGGSGQTQRSAPFHLHTRSQRRPQKCGN